MQLIQLQIIVVVSIGRRAHKLKREDEATSLEDILSSLIFTILIAMLVWMVIEMVSIRLRRMRQMLICEFKRGDFSCLSCLHLQTR